MKKIGILDPLGINLNPLNNNKYSDSYKKLALIWNKFPAYQHINKIIESISKNQVILITSGTGSGKTVIIPKVVLHSFNYEKKVAITLPKQIITKSAAEFSADTLDVQIGKEVGYQYKGAPKNANSSKTKLLYATDGTIVAKLLKDPQLTEFNAVVIDEAHERKVQIDFLLYLLKQTCKSRSDFKLIIMSATVNEKIFIDYFADFKFIHFDVGSATNYPIKSIFLKTSLDKNEYIEKGIEIIENILQTTQSGDILFFVASVQETFDSCLNFNDNNDFCIEVYAGMDQKKQELAQHESLYKESTKKTRKIVIATNVAESSLTISNIEFVIDSGYELFSYYNPKTMASVLEKKLITHAQATQRMGRAGRTREGTCYHLYTENDYNNKMDKFPQPSIQTSNIYGECLKLLNLEQIGTISNLKQTLSEFIEPPTKEYIDSALSQLKKLKLIDSENITTLGKLIADLQMDPMEGLSIYYGYQLGCAKEIIAIVSMLNVTKGNINELFIVLHDNVSEKIKTHYNEKRKNLMNKYGDHLSLLKIFMKYKLIRKDLSKMHTWSYISFLKHNILEKAYKHFVKIKDNLLNKLKDNAVNYINRTGYSLVDKIIASFMFGFSMNIASYNKKNASYRTEKTNDAKISKNSWLAHSKTIKKEVIYYELFYMSKHELKIVSSIPTKSKQLVKELRSNQIIKNE